MYTVTVIKRFEAKHYLTIPRSGPENRLHTHRYRVALRLEGRRLDRNGYLVDIDDVEKVLQALIARYRGAVLNELPEFTRLNPSIERLARLFCSRCAKELARSPVEALRVTIAESSAAYASYRQETRR